MFIKLNLTKLGSMFIDDLESKLKSLSNSNSNLKPYLYVIVNGNAVHRINLLRVYLKSREKTLLAKAEEIIADYLDDDLDLLPNQQQQQASNEDTTNNKIVNDDASQDSSASHFDYVDIKDQMKQAVDANKLDKSGQFYVINVKLSLSNHLLNLTKSIERVEHLLDKIDEHVALNIKFGNKQPPSITTNHQHQHDDQQEQMSPSSLSSGRSRRQTSVNKNNNNNMKKSKSTHHHHHSNNQQQQQQSSSSSSYNDHKRFRDCSELRRLGFTSANYTCCREVISFSMEQLGWSHWILSPKVIEYKYCRGGCLSKKKTIKK